jgi:ADP-ribose pyrophosphatase YjhB (NUDIX family)
MRNQKRIAKKKGPASGKEVSVLAWIEDAFGNVLLIRQAARGKLWSLPGGKVRATEPIKQALYREILEEIGLVVVSARVIDLFDRPHKAGLAVLFRTVLRKGALKLGETEIVDAAFVDRLPTNATPSARYFWSRHFLPKCGKGNALEL